jgi:hypothetical protein
MTPDKVYPKRHEIDIKFQEKYGVSAYKHPRMGKKSFEKKMKKEGFTYKEFLERNPIYKWNFELNKKIALPEGIPDNIRESIIKSYDNAETIKNEAELSKWFMKYNMINLIGIIGLL